MITVISEDSRHRPIGHRLDCRRLPNPYAIPRFRPRDGRNTELRAWLTEHVGAQQLITEGLRAVNSGETTLTTTCSAGRHRSVAIAEELADRLRADGHQVTIEHRALDRATGKKRTTTAAGLGWNHQQDRERLLRHWRPGDTCWWCGRPMDRAHTLDADHSESRSHGGKHADRLLHSRCNRQRGDGTRDHLRPALHTPGGLPTLPVTMTQGGIDPRWPDTITPDPVPTGTFAWGNVHLT